MRHPNWHFVLVAGSSVPLLVSLLIATTLHTPQLCLVFKVVWADPGDLWLVNPLVNPLWLPPPYPKLILIGGTLLLEIRQRDCYVAPVKDAQSERVGQEGRWWCSVFGCHPNSPSFMWTQFMPAGEASEWLHSRPLASTKPIWYHVHCETRTGGWYEGVTNGFPTDRLQVPARCLKAHACFIRQDISEGA